MMTDKAGDEDLMVRYLLGALPEEDQLRIEELFLHNDQYYEQLLALEDELFYDYAQGNLPPAEREQFERRFLTSEQNRRRAAAAATLTRALPEVKSSAAAKPTPVHQQASLRRRVLRSSFGRRGAAAISLAALAVAMCVSAWLVLKISELQTEFDRFQAQHMKQEEQLQQEARRERVRVDDLTLKLKREQDQNAELKRELETLQARSERQGRRFPSALSLVLSPSLIRGQNTDLERLYLPPMTRLLKLQLNLKNEVDYRSYQAILLTAEGSRRWSQDLLIAERTAAGRTLVLRLPAWFLETGDYELKLKGRTPSGMLEETGNYYYFSILKASAEKEN